MENNIDNVNKENNNILCINCFKNIDLTIGDGEICPHCGANNHKEQLYAALPYRTHLQDRFIVGRVKAANGEGFTYKAYDERNHCLVEIREFCPVTLLYRDGTKLFPSTGKDNEVSFLYKDFLVLANSLTAVGVLNAVIPVVTTFIENNTCYIVYKYYESISLSSYVDSKGGLLDYNTVQNIFTPLINSLSTMHSLGIMHLGITPNTLRVCKDGKMRLSEFSSSNLGRVGSPISPNLTSGCAAIEQYKESKIGEYTDVYAVAACMMYAISGRIPMSSVKRIDNPSLFISGDILKNIPQELILALANALQIMPTNRTKTFAEFKEDLFPKPVEEVPDMKVVEITKNIVEKTTRPTNKISGNKKILVITFILSGLILYGLFSNYVENINISVKDVIAFFTDTLEIEEESVIVPSLVGESYESWVAKVAVNSAYNFTIEVSEERLSNTVSNGNIISQSPSALEEIEAGGVITVVVSIGSTERSLPSVVSKTYEDAVILLEEEGFVVVMETQSSDTIEEGIVLWYGDDKNVGDVLTYGSTVILVVSSGIS